MKRDIVLETCHGARRPPLAKMPGLAPLFLSLALCVCSMPLLVSLSFSLSLASRHLSVSILFISLVFPFPSLTSFMSQYLSLYSISLSFLSSLSRSLSVSEGSVADQTWPNWPLSLETGVTVLVCQLVPVCFLKGLGELEGP